MPIDKSVSETINLREGSMANNGNDRRDAPRDLSRRNLLRGVGLV